MAWLFFLSLFFCATNAPLAVGTTPSPIDFDRDIRSILADNYLHSRGTDEAKRVGDLRLDSREGAIEQSKVIVPEVPEESLLIERIFTDDSDEIMHLLGINHEQLTYTFQCRRFRLTDSLGQGVHDLLA